MDQTIPLGTAQLVTSRAALFRVTTEQERELSTLYLSACMSVPLLVFSTSGNEAVNFQDYAASVVEKSSRYSFTSLNQPRPSLSPVPLNSRFLDNFFVATAYTKFHKNSTNEEAADNTSQADART